jgi:two-component system, NtrC family, sensor kinase
MTATPDNAAPDPQQIIAELQRKLDESRAELAARNSAYSERIAYQAAANDVLKVMSASPGDPQPVFDLIVERARDLCGGYGATVYEFDGTLIHWRAATGVSDNPSARQVVEAMYPMGPTREWPSGRAIIDRQIIHISDLETEPGLTPALRGLTVKSAVLVPLMRGGLPIGVLSLGSRERGGFTDTQIELLKTFAEQAVIAIENARLFDEVQAKTRDLEEALEQESAGSEVLKLISMSSGDLEPVFQKLLESATRLCGAEFGIMNLLSGGSVRQVSFYNMPEAYVSEWSGKQYPPHPESVMGTVMRTRQAVHVDDLRTRPAYLAGNPAVVALSDIAGARTYVGVPLLQRDELVGMISIYRREVRPFDEKQVQLVERFASQAVIALENARLLNELRERTHQLSRSLENLRAAQDRLIQTEKLASLGQLTAGIAHEIKNPLNFVTNFSTLSAELIAELKDVLGRATLVDNLRTEVEELTGLLKENLDKVVQHGKRADSIVKNMLQHSREGSGEHRPADINAIVDESLNLAYHGARAEKAGFSIAFQRDLDPSVGMADVYPQEITRVLLNLISNGFYAATKRKVEAGDGFEPMISAATKNLGDKVEIRIRDNGTGIPEGVKEKIFNPFFTTKPSGEGTGLGLSMSHDIIVKQHGGSIDVETERGLFTEFKIVLPRTNQR